MIIQGALRDISDSRPEMRRDDGVVMGGEVRGGRTTGGRRRVGGPRAPSLATSAKIRGARRFRSITRIYKSTENPSSG